MKTIVLVALLAAAGCGSKKGPDCSAAISQSIDRSMAEVKKAMAGSPRLEAALKMTDRLKAAMTQRCNDDRWPPEAVSCFAAAARSEDRKACEDKLSRDQRTKLETEVFPILMGGRGASGSRMSPGVAGHPPTLTGSTGGSGPPPGEAAGSAPDGSAAAPSAPAPPPSGSSSN